MNVFARFDEIHSRTLQDIKKYAHTKAIVVVVVVGIFLHCLENFTDVNYEP